MAENIIAFVVFLVTSLVMVGIGVSQMKSKTPVGFYTYEKPPKKEQLSDMEAWNKKHGMMWGAYGIAIMGSFLVCVFVSNEIVALVIFLSVICGALPIMMWYHAYLQKLYLKEDTEN